MVVARQLVELLDQHGPVLHPELREQAVKGLVLLRGHGMVEASTLLPLFFKLFRCNDKVRHGLEVTMSAGRKNWINHSPRWSHNSSDRPSSS